ncbi:MAG: CHAT domain-containing protein [Anaerolineae bacterium]|nr:CHAT domain-containing protein [Anaerolineae bacterium]
MTPQEIASLLLNHSRQPDFSQTLQQLAPQLTPDVLNALVRRISDEQLRNPRRALQFVDVAEQVAAALGTATAQGLITWVRGNVLYYLNHYREALDCFQKAESFYHLQGDDLTVAGLQVNQVSVWRDLGDYPTALTQETKARAACTAVGERAVGYLANLEMTVGWIYEEIGQPETALATYDRGRAIFVQRNNHISTALIDVNRANALTKMDRFTEAASLLQEAILTLRVGGYDQEVARAELNLGILAHRMGRYQEALRHLDTAYHLFAAIPIPSEMAVVNLERSFVYGRLHLFQDMVILAAAAEKTFRCHHMRRELNQSLIYQGIAYQQLELMDMAERKLKWARRYLHQQRAQGKLLVLDIQRARLYWAMNQPERASRIAQRVERLLDPTRLPSLAAQTQLLMAQWAIVGERWVEANMRLQTARDLAQTYYLAELQIEAAYMAGFIWEKNGQLAEALQQYQQAIQKTQHLQTYFSLDELRLGFDESKQPLYQDAVRLIYQLVQAGQATLADLLTILNQTHSAPLLQMSLNESTTNQPSPWQTQLTELRQTWQWYQHNLEPLRQAELATSGGKMAEWQAQLAQLETAITDLRRRERLWLAATPPLDAVPIEEYQSSGLMLEQLQACLIPGESLLHYFIVHGQLQALLVTPQTVQMFPDLITITQLQRLMKAWRFFIQHSHATWQAADFQHQHAQTYLRALYEMVLAPLQSYLHGVHHLSVVLPPDWHDIPVAALFDGQHYLVESCSITYLSTPTSLLRKTVYPNPPEQKALVVGFSDNGRLPHAPAEAQQITRFFKPENVTCLVEDEATQEAFQAASQEAEFIHLATHAFYRPDNPLFSWMRLANGRITVGDLYHLTLPKRPLVVLSACETGRGQTRGGGLFGMGRALLAAGARGLVVTLWPVHDQTTAEWMVLFYRLLHEHPPALALCQAQQAAIRNGRSPFTWAGIAFLAG